jgi:HAD superfamily hydrolase (TIGR01549 family)
MIESVIFDVDGTLVDSVDLHARAWQDALAVFGKRIPFHKIRAQIGKGGDQLLPVFLTDEEMHQIAGEISQERKTLFAERYLPEVCAFANVRALFERLLQDGRKVALASSADEDELKIYKERAHISDLLETETSKDDAEKSKPHPDIFEAALDRLGNPPPDHTIVVGDTPYDIDAARKAGIPSIAVRSGGFPEDTLVDAIAIYDNITDLLLNYERSPLHDPFMASN